MSSLDIITTSFGLSKGDTLKGDDYVVYKNLDGITIGIVCDGVGSAMYGDRASKRVGDFLLQSLKNRPKSWSIEKSIHHFISNINQILYRESIQEYGDVELLTTLALVVIEGDRLYGANVGDSRIYLKRDDKLTQLSHDHTYDESMHGVLSQAIGAKENVEIYYFENNLQPKDTILLCSDGLYSELDIDELMHGMSIGASHLVKKASSKCHDNLPDDTTALVLEIKKLDIRRELKNAKLIIQDEYKVGEIVDGYKLIKPLIQNQRTWLCENKGIKYVIKFAPYEAIEDEVILDLFVKEVWIAKELKAGFFPKAVVPKKRTHRYYIMSYIEGITLKEYMSKKPLSIDMAIDLAKFLLKMSQYLIKHDFVHADIKPENIIITKRKDKEVFKMVDFGSISQAYSLINKAGTPSYIAPERFQGLPICEQSEIYAIGVTLYEALSKKLPFGYIEPFQNPNFDKRVKSISKLNAKVPAWLQSIIHKSISVDTDIRYHNYSEMLYEINHPDKVKAFYDKNVPFMKKYEKEVYKVGFVTMFVLNLVLVLKCFG
jgi:serine/threonine protein phosphatase PrpC